MINKKKIHLNPFHDPISTIVYLANSEDVETVLIDGNLVMENKVIKSVDEKELIEKAYKASKNLIERTSLSVKLKVERFE